MRRLLLSLTAALTLLAPAAPRAEAAKLSKAEKRQLREDRKAGRDSFSEARDGRDQDRVLRAEDLRPAKGNSRDDLRAAPRVAKSDVFETMIREDLRSKGFDLELSPEAKAQVDDLVRTTPERQQRWVEETKNFAALADKGIEDPSVLRDEREKPWVSIDNDNAQGDVTTRDMDQIQRAERLPDGKIRISVAITDVDELVPQGSPLDARVEHNSTSLYTPIGNFPMLSEKIANDLGSLLGGQDRPAVVYQYDVDPRTGDRTNGTVYRALVRNQAELGYGKVGAWLEQRGEVPPAVADSPELIANLKIQSEAASALRGKRMADGALVFGSHKARVEVKNGQVTDVKLDERNMANDLVEDLMVGSNRTNGEFLDNGGVPALYRVLPEPEAEKWALIRQIVGQAGGKLPSSPNGPALGEFLRAKAAQVQSGTLSASDFETLSTSLIRNLGAAYFEAHLPGQGGTGHFALAAEEYAYATAPMRRADGLVNQRQDKALLKNISAKLNGRAAPAPAYPSDALTGLAEHFTEQGASARKADRTSTQKVMQSLLENHAGQTLQARVVGAPNKQDPTYKARVEIKTEDGRVLQIPVDGRLSAQRGAFDIGQRIQVRIGKVALKSEGLKLLRVN